ncbi:MAG: endonuclease/exonuclease/phosphatase family protein [Clostridiales Family XIII bacterium]|jgi:endonuclease/exonuclease/phosphatase family metal-dependent hydrolase|nr:endonuclease/exonuclease/phosphatase family protein [Clostridiales Family XIII bacterium]
MNTTKRKAIIKRVVKTVVIAIAVLIVAALLYVLYVTLNGGRIEDNLPIEIGRTEGAQADSTRLQTDEAYTVLTFNIGFGAYDHDFSFFMDKGIMADGTEKQGVLSRGADKAALERNTKTVTDEAAAENADIMIFQEVDRKADRSHGVDQADHILKSFSGGLWYAYATNFHTGYLLYPPTKPIGAISDSGILTLSNYEIREAERRSLPITDAFPTKYFDLDRCLLISRMPVTDSDGNAAGELVLANIHPSAYDEGGQIRAQQMAVIKALMADEYAKGHYVIIGGDFNHAFGGSNSMFMNEMKQPEWVQPFDNDMLPEHYSVVYADNLSEVGTCRDTSIPYTKGVNYEVVVDGFVVSDNISATSKNIDEDYSGSDHNPVKLTFTLKGGE